MNTSPTPICRKRWTSGTKLPLWTPFREPPGSTRFILRVPFFLLLAPLGHIKKSKRAHTGWAGRHSGPAVPCTSSSSSPRSYKRLRARSICRRAETQEAHCICTGCQIRAFKSILAPAYLLPHDKTKTDGDKRRTGGGLMRSLNPARATCEVALTQTLAPAVLGVESHSLQRRSRPPRAGCWVQVVALPQGRSWGMTRIVASWVRFRKAERNPAFLLSSLSRQDRCN